MCRMGSWGFILLWSYQKFVLLFSFLFPFFSDRYRDRGLLCACVWVHAGENSFVNFLPVCGTMLLLRARHCFTFATGLVECLCFAGAVFGWASLVFVLKTEGYFSSLCVNTTGVNATHVLGQFDLLTFTASECLYTSMLQKVEHHLSNQLLKMSEEWRSSMLVRSVTHFHVSTDCSGQDEQFSLVFTIASFTNNFLTLPSGFLFDYFGTTVARFFAMWVQQQQPYILIKSKWSVDFLSTFLFSLLLFSSVEQRNSVKVSKNTSI